MDADGLKRLALDLATVAEQLRDTSQATARQVEAGARTLLHTIQAQAQVAIEHGALQATERCVAQLDSSARHAQWAAQALAEQRRLLTRSQRNLVHAGLGALLLGSVLALGSSWYWVQRSRNEIARNQVDAELLRLYNAADVMPCDGRLCANVDPAGRGFGTGRQYRPVKPR